MFRLTLFSLLTCALMANADEGTKSGDAAHDSAAPEAVTKPVASESPSPEKKKSDKKAPTKAKATKATKKKDNRDVFAVVNTSLGSFTLKLYKDKAPRSVENFVGLAQGTKEWTDPKTGKKVKRPFYDGLTFHRVIKGFMIQGGDPLGDGTGDPGYKNETETNPELKHDKPGILAMANAGNDTDGSQFYVTVAPTPWLDDKRPGQKGYSIFGEVVDGMDKVIAISEVPVGDAAKPVTAVTIKSIKIERR